MSIPFMGILKLHERVFEDAKRVESVSICLGIFAMWAVSRFRCMVAR